MASTIWQCCLIVALFVFEVMETVDVQKLSAKRPFCKRGRKFFMNGTCHRCLMNCPEGQMLNMSYTITIGINGAEDCRPCILCPAGTFKTKMTAELYGPKCLPERNCTEEGMEFVKHTDGVNQSECGNCLPGYFTNENGDCFPCTKWNRHEPRCMALFTIPPSTIPLSTFLSTIATPMNEHSTTSHSDDYFEEKSDPSDYQVFGIIGGVVLVLLFVVVLVCCLKKKCIAAEARDFGSSASQRPFLGHQCDLVTDGPDVVHVSLDDLDNIDFLSPEEEDHCRKIKLARRDKYISIVGKKVNKSLEPLYEYLEIPENVVYQNKEIYEYTDKNIPEKEVQIFNEWLQLSGDGHTLFELYTALKDLKYNYILHHMIPIIRANVDAS